MYKKLTTVLTFIIAIGMISFPVAAAPTQASSGQQTYLVLYKQEKVPADAAGVINQAGGTLVYSYDQIGVAIA